MIVAVICAFFLPISYVVNDGIYDYLLEVFVKEDILGIENLAECINAHIEKISKILKFNVGKIQYEVIGVSKKYVDNDVFLENRFTISNKQYSKLHIEKKIVGFIITPSFTKLYHKK